MERIEPGLDPTKALDGEEEMTDDWANHEPYQKRLAEQWSKTGCAAEGAPHVARALLHRLEDPDSSPFPS